MIEPFILQPRKIIVPVPSTIKSFAFVLFYSALGGRRFFVLALTLDNKFCDFLGGD